MQFAVDSDVTLRSRFECKYIISPAAVPAMREFIQPFMAPDRYAALWEDKRYGICSLYLDTPELELYRQGMSGLKNRMKLRVRTYADGPDAPVFFEVKKRMNGIVAKARSAMERRRALPVLDHLVNRRLCHRPERQRPALGHDVHLLVRRRHAALR